MTVVTRILLDCTVSLGDTRTMSPHQTLTSTTTQQTSCLKDTARLDPAWKKRTSLMQATCQHDFYEPGAPQSYAWARDDRLNRPRVNGLLVFELREKLSTSRLADALLSLRMATRNESKDLMSKPEHMGYYFAFLDCLDRQGEAALNLAGGKDSPVTTDVDQPLKQQRAGGTRRTLFDRSLCSHRIDYTEITILSSAHAR